MNFYELTIHTDNRFPPDGSDHVLEGRLDGRRILGWWSNAEFQRWLTSRDGTIVPSDPDENMLIITARLTKKEAK